MADSAPVLREPANRVSPRAPARWRVGAATIVLLGAAALGVVTVVTGAVLWFLWWPSYAVAATAYLVTMPRLRYATHRWEVTPTAIYTQSGWIGRLREIVPMSRVQTIDVHEGALDRIFGLATVSISTAAEDGMEIALLDTEVARDLAARLTAAAETEIGDAT